MITDYSESLRSSERRVAGQISIPTMRNYKKQQGETQVSHISFI